MKLIDLIQGNYKVISVVGMAKNAGKTVALNEIISQSAEKGIVLGITSIGRDGERRDIVTNTDKPLVYVNEGTLIATAEKLVAISDASLEILEITPVTTPLGRIVVTRVKLDGYVEIAGPSTNKDVQLISSRMLYHGADLVLVDGALDRVSSASPAITEAAVLSTGAVLSRDMNKVISETVHKVGLFKLPVLKDESIRRLAERAFEERKIIIVSEDLEITEVEVKTAINAGGTIARSLSENSLYVVLPGSLVTKTLTDFMTASDLYRQVTMVVADATKIFVESRDWLQLTRAGIRVEVVDNINLIAVTINPYSPHGYFFDPYLFKTAVASCVGDVPVFDVMGG